MEIRAQSLLGRDIKNIFFIFIYIFVSFFGKNKHFKNHTHFTHLIKDIVLEWALCGC